MWIREQGCAGIFLVIVVLLNVLVPVNSVYGQDGHHQINEEEIHFFPKISVTIPDFPAEGYVLDIGGGGEGVIGQLKGSQVIAIDINQRELEDAPPGPLKIVMDATDLKFLKNSFATVTCFYTAMYIPENLHTSVFQEVYRVMQPGGVFRLWDVVYPPRTETDKEVGIVLLNIKLPGGEVNTGYGAKWPDAGRPLSHYQKLAMAAGFTEITAKTDAHTFYLELKKPTKQ